MSKYSEVLQIPGRLIKVGSGDLPFAPGGAFTIAWCNEETTIVGRPATVGGDETVSLTVLAGSPCPVALIEIVSTSADIIVGQ